MPTDNDELWSETAKLLQRRPGWKIQAMATPGARPYWIFAAGAGGELAVTIDDGAINVDAGKNELISFGSVRDFAAWLTANRPGALQEPGDGFLEKLRSRKLFRW